MQENGKKDQPTEQAVDRKPGSDGHAIEYRVHSEPAQNGIACMCRDKLTAMGLFSKMEMCDDGVFEKVKCSITGHHQDRRQLRVQFQAFRQHLQY